MAEPLVALVRNAAVLAADRRELALDLLLDDIPVPPGPPVEIAGPVFGQVDLVGMVQVAPGLRRVERMMRVREAGPDAPGRATVRGAIRLAIQPDEIGGAAADPAVSWMESPATGSTPLPNLPLKLDGQRPSPATPPPSVGADTRAVLAELGYTAAAIDALIAQNVVGEPAEHERDAAA